jgi:hypothetical protein
MKKTIVKGQIDTLKTTDVEKSAGFVRSQHDVRTPWRVRGHEHT